MKGWGLSLKFFYAAPLFLVLETKTVSKANIGLINTI